MGKWYQIFKKNKKKQKQFFYESRHSWNLQTWIIMNVSSLILVIQFDKKKIKKNQSFSYGKMISNFLKNNFPMEADIIKIYKPKL